MKKIPLNYFIIGSIFFFSCGKTSFDASFHGHVTYECDGSPVKGLLVNVKWIGSHSSDSYIVGSARTNDNGYYFFDAEVKRPASASNDSYEIITTGDQVPHEPYFIVTGNKKSINTEEKSDNVQIDIQISSYRLCSFHIKNVNPADTSDTFIAISDVFSFDKPYNYMHPGWSGNLRGENVDTTVVLATLPTDILDYNYYYKRNGNQYQVQATTTALCNDTVFNNIFY